MLSDDLFHPLDLDDALEEAAEVGGREAVVDLLLRALDDPRAKGDEAVPEYLDELIDQLTALNRYDEAIAAAYRLIEVDEASRLEELGAIAHLHALNGDAETARGLLERLRGQVEPLEGLMNTLVLAGDLGDRETAVRWLAEDLRRGVVEGWDPDLVLVLRGHFRRLGGTDPQLEAVVGAYLPQTGQEVPGKRIPAGPRFVYPGTDKLDIERGMRADLSARIVTPEGELVPWPPERNDACWCGSAAKYKKCCGRPAV
ncbi:SEC-C domain-containing protein [Actinocorallia sp. API 0066]|uniref:SEC-C domain-containing protein n=1 Tax=Actinocorallia sp. API 0066 TaxID=2896846 RepID=UPI001E5274AB|nr:SEC-C domain-containing protein [Actinocorallia sp. API 0066]MCD0447919.1 SEC-C domain-containing protein [Actinocorallia sp. API 0066]